MKDKEYCITYIVNTEFLEEHYYYVYAKNIEKALKRFKKYKYQREVLEIKEIRLLENKK